MLGAYIAALILGGGLLLLSLLAGHGGHDHDLDATDHDLHAGDHGHGLGDHGSLGDWLFVVLSLRFWTFFLAFAGGTGTILTALGDFSPAVVGVTSAMAGLACGGTAAALFRYLGKEDGPAPASTEEFVGRSAKVTVPVSAARPGKVLLSFGNEVKERIAYGPASEGEIAVGEEVLVLETKDGALVVARGGRS